MRLQKIISEYKGGMNDEIEMPLDFYEWQSKKLQGKEV